MKSTVSVTELCCCKQLQTNNVTVPASYTDSHILTLASAEKETIHRHMKWGVWAS